MGNRIKIKSIQGKIILYFVTTVLLIALVSVGMQYKMTSKRQLEDIRKEVSQLAVASALLIDGDNHEELNAIRDESSNAYTDIRNKLHEFKEEVDVSCVYTLVNKANNNVEFL